MPSWSDAASLLCVRLDSMGDVLMTTPAFRALKQAHPKRRLTLLTSPAGAAIAALIPEIDDVLCYEAPWLKATPPRATAELDRMFGEELRLRKFDAAVLFTVFSQSALPAALLCYWADIPLRLAHCRENPYQLLTDWIPEPEPEAGIRHEVQRQLDLVAHIGCSTDNLALSCAVPPAATTSVRWLLDQMGMDRSVPWAVIHPGATAPSRRYPIEFYAEVADGLSRLGFHLIATGTASEAALVRELQQRMQAPLIPLVNRLSLPEFAALIAAAPVLITNNTGPAHLAAALQTPIVDIYALTNPQHTPWRTPSRVLTHDVDCKYCFKSNCPQGHHACLRAIAPERVIEAALELTASAPEATPAAA